MKIAARQWPDIVRHYEALLPEYAPMLDLVRQIAASPYVDGLAGYTSVTDLIVAQSEANFWHGPDLRVQFDISKQEFLFAYRQRLDDDEPWTRIARAHEGFEVLERFLMKRARWFGKAVRGEEISPTPSSA